MPFFRAQQLRLAGSLLAGGALAFGGMSFGALSAAAEPLASCNAPFLSLGNPSPGAMLMPGAYTIDGVALDPMAQQNSGISDVSVFIDNRDSGGFALGDAQTGYVPSFAPGDEEAVASTPNPGAFHMVVTLPTDILGEHNIVAYARSALTGQQTVVSVPVVFGESPSKAGVDVATLAETNTNPGAAPTGCGGSSTGSESASPAPPSAVTP